MQPQRQLDRTITGGWAAMDQHYFVAALIPQPTAEYQEMIVLRGCNDPSSVFCQHFIEQFNQWSQVVLASVPAIENRDAYRSSCPGGHGYLKHELKKSC